MNTVHINRIKARHLERQRHSFDLDYQLLREAVRLMVEGQQHPRDKRNARFASMKNDNKIDFKVDEE
jgi:hypothetical protein